MKIRINKKIKRIKLPRNIRLVILVVLGLLILLSAYNAYAAYQQPTTKEEIKNPVTYTHTGTYDYNVYLTNNSLYNTTVLRPGEGIYFKKIVDHINASYTYSFLANQPATTEGTYKLEAQVQTNLWSKDFTLIPTTPFSSDTNRAHFTIDIPLDLPFFEAFIQQINNETGVTALETILNIKCMVLLSAKTTYGNINEVFSPSIQVSLGGNIVQIEGVLTTKQTGTIEKTEVVDNIREVANQRTNSAIATLLFSMLFIGFTGVTANYVEPKDTATRQIKKIKKKYGEWIVETGKLPTSKIAEAISVKSLDDLIKISEETGKPVIHVTSNPNRQHTFYVLDDNIHYQYKLPTGERLKKTIRCPKCQAKITCEGIPGKKTHVSCPTCGNKGTVTFEKTDNPVKRLFTFSKR